MRSTAPIGTKGIIEVTSTYLWKYATGSSIASTDDVRSI